MGEFIPRHQAIILGKEIRSMVQHFKAVPDFRGRFESYPLWSMLTIFLATLLRGSARAKGHRQVCPGLEPSPWYPA
jgi:hypothetical protein